MKFLHHWINHFTLFLPLINISSSPHLEVHLIVLSQSLDTLLLLQLINVLTLPLILLLLDLLLMVMM